MENNEQLEQFFDQMKKQDGHLKSPAFPLLKKRRVNLWIPIGIAASVILAFMLIKEPKAIHDRPGEVVIITLHTDENGDQHFTIEQTTHLDTWESPTTSLLTQY
jgi:hypothetical protein